MKTDITAAELYFINPVLTDIFARYSGNSLMAGAVGEDGVMHLSFLAELSIEPPQNCEQFLSLLFELLENGGTSPFSEVYSHFRTELLRDTVAELSSVLDGFVSVRMSLLSDGGTSRTEMTLSRTRTVTNT